MSEPTSSSPSKPSFWQTLPGVLTALAAVITAVSGLLVVLYQNRVLPPPHPNDPSSTTSTEPLAASEPGAGTPKPWSSSEAVVTTLDGHVTSVRAETFSNCISVNQKLDLASGQSLPFEHIRALEVVRADPKDAPNARAHVRITVLDGKTLEEDVAANCDLFGYNDLGRFETTFQQLRRIDFKR